MDGWNTTFLLGTTIFRCYVSFQGCTSPQFWGRKAHFTPIDLTQAFTFEVCWFHRGCRILVTSPIIYLDLFKRYTPTIEHSNGKWTLWRCISYWTWGYLIAMLAYQRVHIHPGFFSLGQKFPPDDGHPRPRGFVPLDSRKVFNSNSTQSIMCLGRAGWYVL